MSDGYAIVCEGVHFAYPPVLEGGGAVPALLGIDLRVRHGESLALIGPNAAGKTTLLLVLAGLAPRLTGGHLGGRVTVRGRVGIVFQEPEGQLFNPTVEAEIAWGPENLGLPRDELLDRIGWAMRAVGLPEEVRHRPPSELSGGQQKRVALAATLAMRPDVLLLDEPTGGLDPAGRREVLEALLALREEVGITVVMAESDPEVVASFAGRVAVLNDGIIERIGKPGDIFADVEWLDSIGAPVPASARLEYMLRTRG